jgi:hypothetical protein
MGQLMPNVPAVLPKEEHALELVREEVAGRNSKQAIPYISW